VKVETYVTNHGDRHILRLDYRLGRGNIAEVGIADCLEFPALLFIPGRFPGGSLALLADTGILRVVHPGATVGATLRTQRRRSSGMQGGGSIRRERVGGVVLLLMLLVLLVLWLLVVVSVLLRVDGVGRSVIVTHVVGAIDSGPSPLACRL
jgi:hypothetical protein